MAELRYRFRRLMETLTWVAVLGATPGLQAEPQTLAVGAYGIENNPPCPATDRKSQRPQDLWRYYMHGVVDHFAAPVDYPTLVPETERQFLDPDERPDTPFKRTTLPAVRLAGAQALTLAPIPIKLKPYHGKTIRIFLWIKGDNAGAAYEGWLAPNFYTEFTDAERNVLSKTRSQFGTRGTFPWHCYYRDVFVPHQAEHLALTLENYRQGIACFSCLSWEPIEAENTYSAAEMQDPMTGSNAYFTLYDPLTYHLRGPFGFQYKWRFLLGQKAGLIGQKYDLTSTDGLRRYYHEVAVKVDQEMNHAVRMLFHTYRIGKERDVLPPMPEDWQQAFADILVGGQDPDTGFWRVQDALYLDLTFHLVHENFAYFGIPRSDRPARTRPWAHLYRPKEFPRPNKVIETVLGLQSLYRDADGREHRAAWSKAANRYSPDFDRYTQEKCDLRLTWDAMHLLQVASNYVDASTRQKVYAAVRDAVACMLKHNFVSDGRWKQSDLDPHPTGGGYILGDGILFTSDYLERKTDAALPQPEIGVEPLTLDAYTFKWQNASAETNAVRLYSLPAEVPVERLTEQDLVGIIHRQGSHLHTMDPFIAWERMRTAGARYFGISAELPPASDWRGRKYDKWKLRMLRQPIPYSRNAAPLAVQLYRPETSTVYATSATWYGEESEPVRVPIP